MKIEYRLLSKGQVFGDNIINTIKAVGTVCVATDFAAMTGAKIHGAEACEWFLSSDIGYGDVCAVDKKGESRAVYANSYGNVRPAFTCDDITVLSSSVKKTVAGLNEIEFGEYPQYVVDKEKALFLENEFNAGRLRKTGKKYSVLYEEYHCEGEKFVRMPCLLERECVLSDKKSYKNGAFAWLAVSPVKWLYDDNEKLLISNDVLVSGQQYHEENYYNGEFETTVVYKFLNTTFAKDIAPSIISEMTKEEKAEHERQMQRDAKRRNPYGFAFGEVSEEEIIRGAIESNVPVFLHGPSSEGKSARVKQIDPTCEIIYLRNATPDSLNGRSVYNQDSGEMIDIPPVWFKKVVDKCEAEPEKLHVVFFDEINNALPSIQGMAFNIVLDREVNGMWKLPANARVVAAGNDTEDSLAAHQLAEPLFNRFAHVFITTTTNKWLQWARRNNIHPAIYAYIAFKNGETLRSPYDGKKPNADPRKWEMASKMLYATGKPEMLRSLIGEDITDEFVKFCNQAMITVDDVLNDDYSETELNAMNTAERYATVIGLTLAESEHHEKMRNFSAKLGEEFRAVFDSFISLEGE